MKVTPFKKPFHYILFEDFYEEQELSEILDELAYINRPGILLPPEQTEGAMANGVMQKANSGVFLDHLYAGNRGLSFILKNNRKIFSPEVLNHPELWYFKHLSAQKDFTLISYYGEGDYYNPHIDPTAATALTWFFEKPKKFTGGDLFFPDYDLYVECKTNCGILFPGQIRHGVTPVCMTNSSENQKSGRYAMSQFLHVEP